MIPGLYKKVVLPAAMVCIIQGIIYGIFTKWGFIQFRWVLAKWIMVLLVVLSSGIGGIGQMSTILDNVQGNNIERIRLNDGKIILIMIGGQILILCIMTIISIIKPKDKRRSWLR
jgi:hypothetical protein